MGVVSPKLRNSARGQDCAFAIPGVCNHDPETTSLCHLPSEVKGMGNKSDDFHAVFGCAECHQAIDNHRLSKEDELYFSLRALQRTMRIWVRDGLVAVPADLTKTRPGKKAKLPSRPLPSRPFRRAS